MLKTLAKKLLEGLGYKVTRINPFFDVGFMRQKALEMQQVNVVFDIGANQGQYAQSLRRDGYAGRIISFEPLSGAFGLLTANAEGDELWQVQQCAIGSSEGTSRINVANNSWSSSLLKMLPEHVVAAPGSDYVAEEEVKLHKLDTLLGEYCKDSDRIFLKIDTQGYTMEVFKGATHALKRAQGLQVEMSLVSLYEGEPLISDIISFLYAEGFRLFLIVPEFLEPETGRQLQVDGIFFRP